MESSKYFAKFEHFEPFIHSKGLDRRSVNFFRQFLKNLYTETDGYYIEESCLAWSHMIRVANRILTPNNLQVAAVTLHYRGHQWAELVFPQSNVNDIVVDPTGVPFFHQQLDHSKRKPFFGRIANAFPEEHRDFYRNGSEGLLPNSE